MYLFFMTLLFIIPALSHASDVVDLGAGRSRVESFGAASSVSDLGKEMSRGVEARVQLEAQPRLDASVPLDRNMHHFLITVVFVDTKTGRELLEGQVAARTFTARERVAETVRLEPEQGRWIGVLRLPLSGETLIKIGSQLADGKKRIYRFFYEAHAL